MDQVFHEFVRLFNCLKDWIFLSPQRRFFIGYFFPLRAGCYFQTLRQHGPKAIEFSPDDL
jgi:hypothetical protein